MRVRSPGLKRLTIVGGGRSALRHAHVERPVAAEGKAALGLVELHGGNADVEHHAIDLFAGMRVEPRERSLHQAKPLREGRGEVGARRGSHPGRGRSR